MSICTGTLWQTRSPQKNNLTSVKRQVINFMMQNPNTGKWRENNSAVSSSARPHPSTQPPKKPLFMHLKEFLLSWLLLLLFPKLHSHWQRPFRWGRRFLFLLLLYELWLILSRWVRDGQMWIRCVRVLDQVTCPTPETSISGPAEAIPEQFKLILEVKESGEE